MAARASFLSSDWMRKRFYHLHAPWIMLILVLLFQQTRFSELIENLTVNLRFEARQSFDPPADPRLVFVFIDQDSLDRLGAWPWPRTMIADFLKDIVNANANPHTVAFDLLFTDDYDKFHDLVSRSGEDFDLTLGNMMNELPSVISGAYSVAEPPDSEERKATEAETAKELLKDESQSLTQPFKNVRGNVNAVFGTNVATFPVPDIRRQSLFGFINDEPSPIDGMRHTIPLIVRVRDKIYPSLALQMLCQMLNVDPGNVEIDLPSLVVRLKNLSGKTWTIPIDRKGLFTINYRRERSFDSVSFFWLFRNLHLSAQNNLPIPPSCDIRNKTILIGESALGLSDLGPSPVASQSPLAYTHLNVINNVLKNDYLLSIPLPWVVLGWCFYAWASLLGLREAPITYAIAVPLAVAALYVIFAFAIFWVWSLQIALAWPLLAYGLVNFGAFVLRWREELQGRRQLRSLFSRMLSQEVMEHLVEHPENLKLGGTLRPATILFSDIRDYTKISEHLKTEEFVEQLNIYFERMVDCVKEYHGTFHKFIGDAVMAAWGDIAALSLGVEQDARNAVRAALMMRLRLRILNRERQDAGLPPLRIGIGLNHGEVVAGLMGASIRSEFTVIGDPVNVASRLEGMTKTFHTDLAIGESVRRLLGDDFLVRRLGLVQLKGKSAPTVVYEVLAEMTDLGESRMTKDDVARYEEAFDFFLDRRFVEAVAGFQLFAKRHPDDYCANRYLEASREFILNPPPPDWDGRIVMETK